MAYQLTERPYKFSYSLNPVRYLVEINNPDTPGCALEVELYMLNYPDVYNAVTNPGTLVTAQTLYPNPDGKVYFYCEDFLNSHLEWQLPSIFLDGNPGDVIAVTSQLKKYYIRYRQITRSNPSPPWATDADNILMVLKGGVAKEKFDRNNFFINYLPDKKPFLTWQPSDHFIGIDETKCLTYLHHDDSTPELLLKARVVYTDGTEDIVEKAFPPLAESLLFHLPSSVKHITETIVNDKIIWYYDISVVSTTGTEYTNVFRLYVDYRKFYNMFSFFYNNSLGGMDTVRILGEYDIEIVREYTDIQKATGGDFSGPELPTENGAININKYEVYKGDAGFQNSPAMHDSLQDLLLSDNCFRIVFNRWLRVINMQKTQQMGSNKDTKWNFLLQWRYTFNNTQYTPFGKDLGAGSDDTVPGPVYGTCTAPGNLVAEFIGEDAGEVEYHFTWDAVGGSEGYELQYQLAGSPDWVTVATTDPEATVTFDVEGEYNWRVRTKCGTDDYSAYSNGDGFEIDLTEFLCEAPAPLTVTLLSIDDTNATIRFSWPAVPGVSGYQIEWRPIGTSVWNTQLVTTLNHDVVLSNNVQYQCRVRSKCDELGNYSGYVYGSNFIPANMIGTCNAPNGLAAALVYDFAGTKVFKLSWNPLTGVDSFQVQIRELGATTWTIVDVSDTDTSFPTFDMGVTYEWRVRSNCTGGGFSNFSNGPNFSS